MSALDRQTYFASLQQLAGGGSATSDGEEYQMILLWRPDVTPCRMIISYTVSHACQISAG